MINGLRPGGKHVDHLRKRNFHATRCAVAYRGLTTMADHNDIRLQSIERVTREAILPGERR